MRRRSTRIGLDIDKPSQLQLLSTFFNAHYFFPDRRITVKRTGKGYHFKIYIQHSLRENFITRMNLLDDSIRIKIDEDRVRVGLEDWTDTLFGWKGQAHGKTLSRETDCNPLALPFCSQLPAAKRR